MNELIYKLDFARTTQEENILTIPFENSNIRHLYINTNTYMSYIVVMDFDRNILDTKAIRLSKTDIKYIESVVNCNV